MKRSRIIRTYILQLRPNAGKAEAARHAIWWSTRLCLDYVQRLHHLPLTLSVSTRGRGKLDNSALKRARDLLRAGRAAQEVAGRRFKKPATVAVISDASIAPARHTDYPFWVKVSCGPHIPALPHRAFSRALREGGKLRPFCEIRYGRNGGLVARVFVQYERKTPTASRDYLGCDVGVNRAVSTSDGYTARSLRPIIERAREKQAEQRRQGLVRSSPRSAIKQRLDREARRIVTLAKRGNKCLVLERLKTLGNLKPSGKIGGWPRRHFGERVRQIAEVVGVAVVEVHPAYTSQACLRCGHVDRKNRRGIQFACLRCGYTVHADVGAARNLVRKARGTFVYPERQKGREYKHSR